MIIYWLDIIKSFGANIIIPLIDDFVIELDNTCNSKHVLDKGDIILIKEIDYITSGKFLRFVYI